MLFGNIDVLDKYTISQRILQKVTWGGKASVTFFPMLKPFNNVSALVNKLPSEPKWKF